ncbi:MAG: hypothetical protein RLZZ175_71 [Bacteroidota bacterium]|jgi:hypothetical protein
METKFQMCGKVVLFIFITLFIPLDRVFANENNFQDSVQLYTNNSKLMNTGIKQPYEIYAQIDTALSNSKISVLTFFIKNSKTGKIVLKSDSLFQEELDERYILTISDSIINVQYKIKLIDMESKEWNANDYNLFETKISLSLNGITIKPIAYLFKTPVIKEFMKKKVYSDFEIFKKQYNKNLDKFNKNQGGESLIHLSDELLYLALGGDKKAEKLFYNLSKHFQFDGLYAEIHSFNRNKLELIKKYSSKK